MSDAPSDLSYRALLRVPTLGRVLVSMQVGRVAQGMVSIALVLFTLQRYRSPELAGLVTLASVLPGLLVSPLAGALLDRHGRIRLVMLDYLVALAAMVAIGLLALADALPAWLLVGIAVVSSLTSILSHTGLRSLFPLVVPPPLWERVNAIDSNGYLVATILGPPMAAGLVAIAGGPVALIAIGLSFGIAAVALRGAIDPPSPSKTEGGRLVANAWTGLVYVWRNPTLRGLGFAISLLNVAAGMVAIVVPLIVLNRLNQGEAVVGLVYAVTGVFGVAAAFAFGRVDTRDREWSLLVWAAVAAVPVMAILLPAAMADPAVGVLLLALHFAAMGIVWGAGDIALFTVRQRRTDPAIMGRAFAVSMAVNYIGVPLGAGLAGLLAARSIELAIVVLGIGGSVLGAACAALLVPRYAPDIGAGVAGLAVREPLPEPDLGVG